MIGMIAAVAPDGLIGCETGIPWRYPLDLAHFKTVTTGSTVIMGRKTWDSLPTKFKPLPDRQNLIVSRTPGVMGSPLPPRMVCPSIETAIGRAHNGCDVWIIGGGEIYRLGLQYANRIVLTLVPDVLTPTDPVYFPFLSPATWKPTLDYSKHADPRLRLCNHWRII